MILRSEGRDNSTPDEESFVPVFMEADYIRYYYDEQTLESGRAELVCH